MIRYLITSGAIIAFFAINSYSQVLSTQYVDSVEYLSTVYFSNDNTGYIMGQNNTLLKTFDGGRNWFPFEFFSEDFINDMACISGYQNTREYKYWLIYSDYYEKNGIGFLIFGSGIDDNVLIKIVNGIPITCTSAGISDIYPYGEDSLIVVGLDPFNYSYPYFYYLIEINSSPLISMGSLFELTEDTILEDKPGIWIDNSLGYKTEYSYPNGKYLSKTSDGGETWDSIVSVPGASSSFFIAENNGWVVGERGMITKIDTAHFEFQIHEDGYHPDSLTISACDGYTSPSGDYYWTESGKHTDTIKVCSDCPKQITIDLTIYNSTYEKFTSNFCEYFATEHNPKYTSPGTYFDTTRNDQGCNHIIEYDLTTTDDLKTTMLITHCGVYHDIYGHWEDMFETGTYLDTIEFHPGCDSIYTTYFTQDCSTNISKQSVQEVTIYPNPTTGIVNIETENLLKVELFDVFGRLSFETNRKEFDISSLKKGIYLLKIYLNDGMIYFRKLVFN